MTAKHDEPKAHIPPAASPFAPPVAATATTAPLTSEDFKTEQEKDLSSDVPGVGPAEPSVHTTGPVETIEDLGIGPREPYPTGETPPEGGVTAKKKGGK